MMAEADAEDMGLPDTERTPDDVAGPDLSGTSEWPAMANEQNANQPPEDYFLKGLLIALGVIAVFSFSFLVLPLAGLIVSFVVGPYLAGYLGGKQTCHGTLMGFLAGMIWSSAQVILIISLAGRFSISGTVKVGPYELFFIVLIYFLNIVFCTIGGWISSSKVPTCVPSNL